MLLLGGVLIAGCAIDPTRDAERVLDAVPAGALADARALERDGQPAAAAEAYLKLAESAPAPARQQLELEAANALLQAGDTRGAARLLRELDTSALTATQRNTALMQEADVALSRDLAAAAVSKLERVKPNALPPTLERQWYGAMAAAYRMLNQPARSAEMLNKLDPRLDDPEARMHNQVALLFTLTDMSHSRLASASRSARGAMRGWIALAQALSKEASSSAAPQATVRNWRQRHRRHPALPGLDEAYSAALNGSYSPGTKTLVLLPSQARFRGAGNVLKGGIQAALDADRNGVRPQLEFRRNVGSAYESGVTTGGAGLVIGPLPKSAVAALRDTGPLPVPTLGLNRPDGASVENLFQFALAPEDEAISAARYAFGAGARRAAILYPQSAWGTRMAQAFREHWRALGGTVTAQASYGSVAAAAETAAVSDAQVALLVATTNTVGRLWDALRSAGFEAPVVATSHVHEGTLNPATFAALDGLYFVDIPWLLDQGHSTSGPSASGAFARLHAMGLDAYRLAPRASAMGEMPGSFFPGQTGGLRIDARGKVHRQLILARFTPSGVVTPDHIDGVPGAQTTGTD